MSDPKSRFLDGEIHQHDGYDISKSNVISRLLFWPVNQLVFGGRKGKDSLEHSQMFKFGSLQAYDVWKEFKPYWIQETSQAEPSLMRALRRAFWPTFLLAIILQIFQASLQFLVPVMLPYMLQHLVVRTEPDWWGYLYAIGVFAGQILGSFFSYHAGFTSWTLAARIRTVLIIMTYKKSLKVGTIKDSGKIVNLVSTDSQLLSDTFQLFMSALLSPAQLIVVTGLIWKDIGPFALIPFGVFFLTMPVAGFVSARLGGLRSAQQAAIDSRLKLVRELISAIRIVKYYAWEVPFGRNINKNRDEEIRRILAVATNRTVAIGIFASVSPLGTGLLYTFYSLSTAFDVTKIFTTLSLLNLLKLPLQFLPLIFVFGSQYVISFNRVQEFCLRPELPKRQVRPSAKYALIMKKASVGYEKDKPILSKMSVKVKTGQILMIVGSVGSGKSTFAASVLSEAPYTTGEIEVNGTLAYVPQEAWIVNASIRDNILFGNPWNEKKYRRVIEASALGPDLAIMPQGDQTHIGDRGINLSGGQRQRVSIARSLYADKDIYVLDDPFSAVDSNVAAHLVENTVKKYIKGAGKTGIIVTNQLQFLGAADQIILLRNGQISEQGTLEELKANGKGFAALIEEFGLKEEPDEAENTMKKKAKSVSQTEKVNTEVKPTAGDESEEKESGTVSFAVYWAYIKAGGIGIWLVALSFLAVVVSMRVFSSIWLSDWSNPLKTTRYERNTWLGVYLGCIFIEVVFFFLYLIPLLFWSRNASRHLHSSLLNAIMRAKISFFDSTPSGRLIARFSKDMSFIDELLAFQFSTYMEITFTLVGIFAQMAATQPFILIGVGVGAIVFLILQRVFQRTAIDIQRLEALSRAPIFSQLSETIEGSACVRAYGMQKQFVRANMNKVNANIADYLSLRYSTGWFGMRLDWVSSMIILTTFIAIFLTRNYGTLDIALAALAMSSTTGIAFSLSALAANAVDLETRMNSVERVRQYLNIPSEAPAEIEDTKPDKSWPSKGEVRFRNLSIAYKPDGDRVLKNITAKIKPREKIGIVGRTGAGKSTLITALFRIVEPVEGTIEIDGLDITKIGLSDLRRQLAIIPQLPTLFIGTVRYNIDPFNEASDDRIWNVLEMVQLKDFIGSLDGKLEAIVDENGSNFSVGQRQLLAMARALLLDAKILLLDEATAAVDNETDQLIQKMVRKNFKNKTVLTIAHRLNTIMDSTRVMVLDKGSLAEFDSPKRLLDDPDTIFSSMVDATGPASAKFLRMVANGEASAVSGTASAIKEKPKKKK